MRSSQNHVIDLHRDLLLIVYIMCNWDFTLGKLKKREVYDNKYICVYMYIYIYIHTSIHIYITDIDKTYYFHRNVTTSCPIYSIALVKCTMQAAKACTKKTRRQ